MLVQRQPLKAIRAAADYAAASLMLDRLAVREDLDVGAQQYLDAMEVLIEAYDDGHAVDGPDSRTPLERLKAAMRSAGTTPAQLRIVLGSSQSMVSMLLNGQRNLSKKAMLRLAGHFKLAPGYFL